MPLPGHCRAPRARGRTLPTPPARGRNRQPWVAPLQALHAEKPLRGLGRRRGGGSDGEGGSSMAPRPSPITRSQPSRRRRLKSKLESTRTRQDQRRGEGWVWGGHASLPLAGIFHPGATEHPAARKSGAQGTREPLPVPKGR